MVRMVLLLKWLVVAVPMVVASLTIDTEQYGWSGVFILISFAGFALIRWRERECCKEFPRR